MSKSLKLGRLTGDQKIYLEKYKTACKIEMDNIAQVLIDTYQTSRSVEKGRSERFKENIQKEHFWNLQGLKFSGNRLGSPGFVLERAVESPQVYENTVFKEMDSRLKSAKKYCEQGIQFYNEKPVANAGKIADFKAQIERINYARAYNRFIQVQAQSVLAEIGSLHQLGNFEKQLEAIYGGEEFNSTYQQLFDDIADIRLLVEEYSLNSLANSTINNYSAKNTLEIREQVSNIIKCVESGLDKLNKKGLLCGKVGDIAMENNKEFLTYILNEANVFFKAKNDINYQNPTEISEFTKKRMEITNIFERTALLCGVIGIGSTVTAALVPATAPVSAPSALLFGGIATISGLGAFALKTGNALANLAQHKVLPTTTETIETGLSVVSIISAGLANVGPVLMSSNDLLKVSTTCLSGGEELSEIMNKDFKDRVQDITQQASVPNLSLSLAANP